MYVNDRTDFILLFVMYNCIEIQNFVYVKRVRAIFTFPFSSYS